MTNAAAIGYAIIAAKQAGLDEKTIQRIENNMRNAMDMITEDEAEKAYFNN